MTIDNILAQMGAGTKQLTERFAEYGAPVHDQHLYYGYEPSSPSHGSEPVSKFSHGGGGHKNNAAMSALTLLAFLFFLHILQQCIKDHMTAMSTPQIVIMTAGREGEAVLKKSDTQKLDKTGLTHTTVKQAETRSDIDSKNVIKEDKNDENKYLMKINTAEPPKSGGQRYKNPYKDIGNRSLQFAGFVSAMDDK